MKRPTCLLALASCLWLATNTITAQNLGLRSNLGLPEVHLVDPEGGGDFTTLVAAIDAAKSGDVILIASDLISSSIVGFDLDGKGLSLIGLGTRPAIRSNGFKCSSNLIVSNLPEGETVVIRNLTIEAGCTPSGPGVIGTVQLENNQGTVWIEDCELRLLSGGGTAAGITATDCDDVVVIRTLVAGPDNSATIFSTRRSALYARDSNVHAFESSFIGTRGPRGLGSVPPRQGAAGADIFINSFVFASDCQFQGGDGGNSGAATCSPGADGGDGALIGFGCQVEVLNSTFSAGGPGLSGPGTCATGLSGADLSNQGTLVTLNAPTRTYAVEDAIVGPGETTTLVATGSPGDIVFSAISYGSLANYQPSLFGTQLFTAPNAIVVEGVIPATGTLQKAIRSAPILGPLTTYRQGFFFSASSAPFFSSASALTTLP